MIKVTVMVLATTALLAVMALAGPGETGSTRMRNSADVVTVAPVPAQLAAAPGERVDFRVDIRIQEKWHLYAHDDTMFIGIDLQPAEGFPLSDLQIEYPAGHEGTFFGETVVMLEGEESIEASAAVPPGLPAGEHTLELALTVQACDDKVCLAPTDVPVHLNLAVK